MVTLASFRARKQEWLLGALTLPYMYLHAPAEGAEWALWQTLEDLAELDDSRAQLDEVSLRLRRWLDVGGAPALPIVAAWTVSYGDLPSKETVAALFVGLISELNLLEAPLRDLPPPPDLPQELPRWASTFAPSWTTLGRTETRTVGLRLGHTLADWVIVHPASLRAERSWVLRPAPTLRQALTFLDVTPHRGHARTSG